MISRHWSVRFVTRALLAAASFALLVGVASHASAQTPTPTPGGNCCVEHEGPSCDNQACNTCVCNIDETCCRSDGLGWDEICVGFAEDDCDDVCSCTQPTPTPGGDCCSPHSPGTGCDDLNCSDCVCAVDDDCCLFGWDATCVSEARDECAGSCPCGVVPTETPAPTPTPGGDCCAAHNGPSCDETSCRECVCNLDSACCNDVWDQTCADEAAVECALSCEQCVTAEDCCSAHETVGCSDAPCKDCVCDLDALCCTEAWDQRCVDEANAECAASCICEAAGSCCEEHGESVGCDNRACQNCVCAIDEACCVEGWDATCADEAANECVARCSECAEIDCCADRGNESGCPVNTECEACVCDVDAFCCDEIWDQGCADIAADDCPSECACGTPSGCPGDCNGTGDVTVNELIIGVNIVLGTANLSSCPAFDTNGDGNVGIPELIQAVNAASNGCP